MVAKNPEKIGSKGCKDKSKAKFGKPTEKLAIRKLDFTEVEFFIWLAWTRIFFCIIAAGLMD